MFEKFKTDAVQIAQTKTDAVGTTLEPHKVFFCIFVLAAVAGLAPLLSSKRALGVRAVASTLLWSGVAGLVIALLWWNIYGETNLYFLIGVSLLAGVGGINTFGVIFLVLRKKLNLDGVFREFLRNGDDEDSAE